MAKKMQTDEIKNNLIEELSKNRPNLYEMLNTIKSFRQKIELFLPPEEKSTGKISFRDKDYSKFLMQENMKNVTSILQAELDVHRAIEGSIKNEYDLRTKSAPEEDFKSDGSFDHIREMLKNVNPETMDQLESIVSKVASRKE